MSNTKKFNENAVTSTKIHKINFNSTGKMTKSHFSVFCFIFRLWLILNCNEKAFFFVLFAKSNITCKALIIFTKCIQPKKIFKRRQFWHQYVELPTDIDSVSARGTKEENDHRKWNTDKTKGNTKKITDNCIFITY